MKNLARELLDGFFTGFNEFINGMKSILADSEAMFLICCIAIIFFSVYACVSLGMIGLNVR